MKFGSASSGRPFCGLSIFAMCTHYVSYNYCYNLDLMVYKLDLMVYKSPLLTGGSLSALQLLTFTVTSSTSATDILSESDVTCTPYTHKHTNHGSVSCWEKVSFDSQEETERIHTQTSYHDSCSLDLL